MAVEQRGPAVGSDSNKKEGKGEMIKTPISLQDLCVRLVLKSQDDIIRIADYSHLAVCPFLAPHVHPETGAEFKVMQELMRHSTIRVTLDTYTQAVTSEKRAAQTAVVALFVRNKKRSKTSS
jgi:hypothetical protein